MSFFSSSEERERIKGLQKRYAYSETLPSLLKVHFLVYTKRLFCGEGLDPDSGRINLNDTRDLFGEFAIEYTQQNIDQFLASLVAEFDNITDSEMLRLLQS